MVLEIIMIICLVAFALWTIVTRSLLRSAIGLAAVSAILTVIMFSLSAPYAAVFELSVCAGLISVLFVSTISLTHGQTKQEILDHMRERLRRFWYLPFIILILGVILFYTNLKFNLQLPAPEVQTNVRNILWGSRQIELIGQIIILLTGVFGVVVLFKERLKK
ncbi:MAG: NADH-quinone oxidoreductase subunit J [Candidatus Omnitrophota bacterium]